MAIEVGGMEAVVLSGGASRRMGRDKASLVIGGERVLDRTLRLLVAGGIPATVLGPQGVPDRVPGSGPLAALAAFGPVAEFVFVVSCDVPLFDARLPILFRRAIGEADAALPLVDGRLQPLCGLYRSDAIFRAEELFESGATRLMEWLDTLHIAPIDEVDLVAMGVAPESVRSANTPEEWDRLVNFAHKP